MPACTYQELTYHVPNRPQMRTYTFLASCLPLSAVSSPSNRKSLNPNFDTNYNPKSRGPPLQNTQDAPGVLLETTEKREAVSGLRLQRPPQPPKHGCRPQGLQNLQVCLTSRSALVISSWSCPVQSGKCWQTDDIQERGVHSSTASVPKQHSPSPCWVTEP